MKTFIFSLVFLLGTTLGFAQEITQLDEARVGFAPLDVEVIENKDGFTYKVTESRAGQFAKDPIAFMKANFDIQNFIALHQGKGYDSYNITFQSGKGILKADFDNNGELVRTFQRFKDKVLPADVRKQLYANYKGWTMTANKYIAYGRGDLVDRELYKIKLENGNQKQNIKLDPNAAGNMGVASLD